MSGFKPGGGGARRNVFVQPNFPQTTELTWLWVQTGIGPENDFTVWIEDGIDDPVDPGPGDPENGLDLGDGTFLAVNNDGDTLDVG